MPVTEEEEDPKEKRTEMCRDAGECDSPSALLEFVCLNQSFFSQINHQKQTPVVVIGWLP